MSGLSSRDTAFLEEMGIGPFWRLRGQTQEQAEPTEAAPAPAPFDAVPAPAAAPVAVQAAAPAPAPVPMQPPPPVYQPGHEPRAPMAPQAPAPALESAWGEEPPPPPPTEEEIANMDWAQLRAAIASCTRCGLCAGGRRPVQGAGAQQAQWLVAAGASTASDEKERQPLSGEPGKLLVNMLAAVDLSRDTNAYVTNLIKCRPTTASGGDRAPTLDEAQACRPWLERELALTGAGMVLTMGQIAANALLGKPLQEPLAGSRGQVHALGEVPLVATLHPGELLRRGADKALAWADLCMARSHDGRSG